LKKKSISNLCLPQHHTHGAASEYGNRKKNLKTYHGKLVNYIFGANEENLPTLSSTAREVGARVNLLYAVQFVTDNWREISSKTIQNRFALCGFKHPRLEMPNTSCIENEATMELQRVTNRDAFRQHQQYSMLQSKLKLRRRG
jgi:hypothetical protein